MPRNVRNFWLDFNVDGRDSALSGGPVRKDGGFSGRIYQRDGGDIADQSIHLAGICYREGGADTVETVITFPKGATVDTFSDGSIRVAVRTVRT